LLGEAEGAKKKKKKQRHLLEVGIPFLELLEVGIPFLELLEVVGNLNCQNSKNENLMSFQPERGKWGSESESERRTWWRSGYCWT